MALDLDLTIIPVVNKIDLASAEPDRVAQEIVDVIGFKKEEVLYVSAKEGTGIDDLLQAIVQRVPPPRGDPDAPLRALIFDSKYDSYKGVIAYVRVIDGRINGTDRLRLMSTNRTVEPLETGTFRPTFSPTDGLDTGEVGYVATGLKTVREVRVGDTITSDSRPAPEPLPGYQPAKSMVFAGLYPAQAEDYEELRDALEKLHLNDASLNYQPEHSMALGPGFRAGFLGLLHMDIVQERLEREYDLDLLATAPSVAYRVRTTDGREFEVDSPADMPDPSTIDEILEPWMTVSIVAPDRYIGAIMELVTGRRGAFHKMEYLEHTAKQGDRRVLLEYEMPLSEMLVDFYDELKSRTQGYASLDYSFADYRAEKLVKSTSSSTRSPSTPSASSSTSTSPGPGPPACRAPALAHPPPALRSPHPGRHRRPHHRPRISEGPSQKRPRQVLRRRRHPQAKAPGEAEEGQEANETRRQRGDPPGSLHVPAPHRQIAGKPQPSRPNRRPDFSLARPPNRPRLPLRTESTKNPTSLGPDF